MRGKVVTAVPTAHAGGESLRGAVVSAQTANLLIAALSFGGAAYLLGEVWIYRRRVFRRAAPFGRVLLVSGVVNATCAYLAK